MNETDFFQASNSVNVNTVVERPLKDENGKLILKSGKNSLIRTCATLKMSH